MADAEDVTRPVQAVVRAEPRVIADDILRRHTLPDCLVPHLCGLVVAHPAVVSRHQQFLHFACPIEHHARRNAIHEYRSRRAEYNGDGSAGSSLYGVDVALPAMYLRLDKCASSKNGYKRQQ